MVNIYNLPDNENLQLDYGGRLDRIRKEEYPYLFNEDGSIHFYLDHAGTTLYCKTSLEKANEKLLSSVFGNPHSQSIPSLNSTVIVDTTRLKILELFHADPDVYDIAFTPNATAAIKLLSQCMHDCFHEFQFMYNWHSHTSVIGVRQLSSEFEVFQDINEAQEKLKSLKHDSCLPTLVAWTGQSNFDGERYPIDEWNIIFKSYQDTYTLLDASSLSTSSPPDLSNSDTSPDFICLSFYKLFGSPDLGGLIFKKAIATDIFKHRRYFGGGTIDAAAADTPFFARKPILTKMVEDGTLPIHSIIQLLVAIETYENVYGGFPRVTAHCKAIRKYATRRLSHLKHTSTNSSMVEIHSEDNKPNHGPILALSLKDENDNYVGYYGFDRYASSKNISCRTGGVCNPGGTCKWLGRSADDILYGYSLGHVCGDSMDLVNGKRTGIIRISFGAMTSKEDIDFFVDTVKEYLSHHLSELFNI